MDKPNLQYRCRKYNKKTNETIIVTISLKDDCNNGHADFSITADGYNGEICSRRGYAFGGSCHEEILKYYPEFKQFVDLHLSDYKGAPMYAKSNGYYHLRDRTATPAQRKAITKNYMRVNDKQFKVLNTAEDQEHFHFLIEQLKLPEKWLSEAQAATIKLEALSSTDWDYSYKWERSQYTPMTQESKEAMQLKIDAGFYTPENIKKRASKADREKYLKTIADIKADAQRSINKIKVERDLKLWLYAKNEVLKNKYAKRGIDFVLHVDNSIYYDHTNELVLNWVDYKALTTPANFKRFMASITEADFQTKLPHGITIQLRDKS